MRILLIAEQDAEFRLIERLLKGNEQMPHQLTWCQADTQAMRGMQLSNFQMLIWGRISDLEVSRALLDELKRQQSNIPVIAICDQFPPNADRAAFERGESDILLRSTLNVEALSRAINFAIEGNHSSVSKIEALHTDPLTGLSNRQTFKERMARILADATLPESVGLMLIDVDQFKKVNASYGQGAGDALIQLIAARIRGALSENQHAARIGGNEFVVMFQNSHETVEKECRACVERIIQSMTKPFPVAQHAIRINVSIGVVMNKEIEITVDSMVANADIAMRIAKSEKGSNFRFYTPDMTDAAQKILQLEAEIRRGIRNEEFELYYQPRIELESERIVGAEGLVRWNHPTRGLLPPAEFISVAEESGLIVPLGYWIIHQACKDLDSLAEQGHHDVQLAVNVSFKQFQDRNFVNTVANILGTQGITAGRLEFELTETTMMIEGLEIDQSLHRLNELGIDISLDDFGTGYSSFAHIQRLPISALKIDRSFVGIVTSNEDDATIVKAIINLAHSLSMQVIAEGAETTEQVEFLRLNKCDQVQGYYFSKPMSFTAIKTLLSEAESGKPLLKSVIPRNNSHLLN